MSEVLTADQAWAILREMDSAQCLSCRPYAKYSGRWGLWEVEVATDSYGDAIRVHLRRQFGAIISDYEEFPCTEAGLRDACAEAAMNYVSEVPEEA